MALYINTLPPYTHLLSLPHRCPSTSRSLLASFTIVTLCFNIHSITMKFTFFALLASTVFLSGFTTAVPNSVAAPNAADLLAARSTSCTAGLGGSNADCQLLVCCFLSDRPKRFQPTNRPTTASTTKSKEHPTSGPKPAVSQQLLAPVYQTSTTQHVVHSLLSFLINPSSCLLFLTMYVLLSLSTGLFMVLIWVMLGLRQHRRIMRMGIRRMSHHGTKLY